MSDEKIIRLILVDESLNEAERVLNVMRKGGYGVRPAHASTARDLRDRLAEHPWDLVIASLDNEAFSLFDVMQILAATNHVLPCIGTAKVYDPGALVQAMRCGARDVVVRGDHEHLMLVVNRELETMDSRRHAHTMELRYWESQGRCMALLESSKDAIAYVHEGMHIHANPTYAQLFGYSEPDDFAGLPLLDLIDQASTEQFKRFFRGLGKSSGDRESEVEITGRRADGGIFSAQMGFSWASFDGEDCHQIIVRDLSDRIEYQKVLRQLSSRDHLTGLFNHRYFLRAVEHSLANERESQDSNIALLFVELENFASIRRSIGVAVADMVVKDFASAIEQAVSKQALLARFGDQTFTVLLKEHDLKAASEVAENLRIAVETCIAEAAGHSLTTTASIGVVAITEHATNAQDVLAQADAACRMAQESGGNCWSVYRAPSLDAKRFEGPRFSAADFAATMRDGRLFLKFQPIVSLTGDSQEIYEVFPTVTLGPGQSISARNLMPLAEAGGFGTELDEWVLDKLLSISAARPKAPDSVRFFVRPSEASIKDESLGLHLTKALKGITFHPSCITFQVSEIMVAGQLRLARAFVNAVRLIGCGAALEHFGAGLNSFQILNHLQVDYLKIDGALIQNLFEDQSNREQVKIIQDRATAAGKQTIATAVQDANSLAVLWQTGVHYAQGRYIQEPSADLDYDFASLGAD